MSARHAERADSTQPPELPDDIDALRALIVAERAAHAAAHAAAIAERNMIADERDLLAIRTEKLEQIVKEIDPILLTVATRESLLTAHLQLSY